ncbi:hypothetical protein [Streptomyces lavendofoliae]|uniref:hypothetical protein n=1 Tax=Streptomyces lavendofoliae TaxID=67314 RepID=UPI00300F5746
MTRTTRLLAVAMIAAVVAAGTATIAAAAGRADTAPAPAALGSMTTLGDNHLPAPPRG